MINKNIIAIIAISSGLLLSTAVQATDQTVTNTTVDKTVVTNVTNQTLPAPVPAPVPAPAPATAPEANKNIVKTPKKAAPKKNLSITEKLKNLIYKKSEVKNEHTTKN